MSLKIERVELLSPAVQALIETLNGELTQRYPEPGATHFHLDPDEVAPGRGAIFVAYLEASAVGCGAVRLISETEAEIKRMYTVPQARGKGVGRAILTPWRRRRDNLELFAWCWRPACASPKPWPSTAAWDSRRFRRSANT
jgi:putative acetyltransferase